MRRSRFLRPGLAAIVLLVASSAAAQTDEQRADARAAATQGSQAFEGGRYAEAIDLFQRAEALVHAPTHLLFIARSQVKVGQFVRARETYRKIIRESLAPNAPSPFRDAQENAKKELGDLEPRIPSIKVVVKGAGDAATQVTMDGAELPSAVIGLMRPVDPGEHKLRATAPGLDSGEMAVTIPEASQRTIEIELHAASAAPSGTPVVAGPPPSDGSSINGAPGGDVTRRSSSGLRTASYVAFGVGVAGLAGGTFFVLRSSSKRSEADNLCGGDRCPISKRTEIDGLYDDAKSAQTLATIGFIVGGVGIASGATLFILSNKGSETNAASTSMHPWIGIGAIGVNGNF